MKIVERARVLSVGDGRAEVVMAGGDDQAKCSACSMASHCESKERRFTVDAPAGVKPGDEVTVEIDAPSPAAAALLLFMLPLAIAFSAGGAAYWLTGSETLSLLGGLGGAAAVYLAIYLTRLGSRTAGRVVGAADDAGGGSGRLQS